MSQEDLQVLSGEEIAKIQAQNTEDYQKAHQIGTAGLENSSASADVDED